MFSLSLDFFINEFIFDDLIISEFIINNLTFNEFVNYWWIQLAFNEFT